MHEVSLCRQLAAAVSRATASRGPGRRVEAVYVDVGQLRQVVPEAMEFAWTFVVRGTALDSARLVLRSIPAVLACASCGAEAQLGPEWGFACRRCGSADTRLSSGEEFVLTAVDVLTDPVPGAVATAPATPATPAKKGTPDGALSPS